ncbi:hypothetical protein LCGC14_1798540 [marine sediment metagenome]|uniref:Uncharacterized protein n=1 Tax=marine sediment metagenome TaxID=412755 RepID=A0A0F9GQ88_9ZZZZ
MKTIGPMSAKGGEVEISVVFSFDPKELFQTLRVSGDDAMCQSINDLINEKFEDFRDDLFTAVTELVRVRQAQIEATGV